MNDLELIKSKIDIVDFIGEYITLKKSGRNFKALCPFHGEKTPSFYVSSERQTWHCFGACSEGGDIFDFLMKWDHVDFAESIKILADKAGVKLSAYTPSKEEKSKERLYEINHLASEFFHYILIKHKIGEKARAYLKKRSINDKIQKTFMLGYAPNTWGGLLKYLKKKNYKDEEIIEAGLAIRGEYGSLYDRFRGRLIFTLKNHRGQPIGFSGRKIDEGDGKEAKYINTPETPIYVKGNVLYGLDQAKESIKREKCAIIVEGEFDFLSSFQAGITNVVAIKGSAFTQQQVNLLKRFTDTVLLALDSDFAGNEAAKKGIEIAENAEFIIKVIRLTFGKDPDECIQKSTLLWKKSIKNTVNIYDFLIERTCQLNDPSDPSGKKRIGDDVIPFLARIKNSIIASHYQRLLAKKLDIKEDAVAEALEKEIKSKREKTKTIKVNAIKRRREELLEEHLLALILSSGNQKEDLKYTLTILDKEDFFLPGVKTIIEELQKYFISHHDLDINLFSKVLTPELSSTFDRAYLREMDLFTKDRSIFLRELKKTVNEIKKIALRRRINILSTKLEKEEETIKDKENMKKQLKDMIQKIALIDKEKV